jgi:hypothetical protein
MNTAFISYGPAMRNGVFGLTASFRHASQDTILCLLKVNPGCSRRMPHISAGARSKASRTASMAIDTNHLRKDMGFELAKQVRGTPAVVLVRPQLDRQVFSLFPTGNLN